MVRIAGHDGVVAGAGFVCAPHVVLSCAHVVSDALGTPRSEAPPPSAEVVVDLPLAGGGRITAGIEHWIPAGADGTGDIAVLRLAAPIAGSRPMPVVEARDTWAHPVRALGFTRRFPGGVWHAGRLRGGTAENWVQLSGADPQGVPVEGGFSGSPVWDEQTGAVVGMVARAQLSGARQGFMIPVRALLTAVPSLEPLLNPSCPFPGLTAFHEQQAEFYFGRDAEADDLAALLENRSHVALVGPSGCGKSSLALAGVVPRLRRSGYEVLVVRPATGVCLYTTVASELSRVARDGAHADSTEADWASRSPELEALLVAQGLPETAPRVLGERGTRLLVVLDQAETLLAGDHRPAEQAADLLFSNRHTGGVRVLATVRADFLDAALSHPDIGRALSRAAVRMLTPMTRDQLDEAIRRPVERIPALSYDAGLVRQMLDDAGERPGALPLVAFVLKYLWDTRKPGLLTFDAYHSIGGVPGALGKYADRAWGDCVTAGNHAEALSLLSALVRVLPGAEKPLRQTLTRTEAGHARWRVAQALAERRILVAGQDPERGQTVELAHEALISAWPTLQRHVSENELFLIWRERLRHDIERWHASNEDPQQLLRGEPLTAAEEQMQSHAEELTPQEREYIEEGLRRRVEELARRVRDRRLKRGGVALLALVTVLVLVAAVGLKVTNDRLGDRLRVAASGQLAADAEQLDDVSLTTSALFSAAAHHTADEADARTALVEEYLRLRRVERIAVEGRGQVRGVAMSEDARRLNVGIDSGAILGLDLTVPGIPPAKPIIKSSSPRTVAISPDGRISARSSTNGLVSIGIRTGHGNAMRTMELRGAEEARSNARPADDVRFDADGARLLAALAHEGVLVWRTSDGHRVGKTLTPPRGWDVAQAWFGADDDSVVGRITPQSAEQDRSSGRLVRWNLATGHLDHTPWGSAPTATVAVSGDGSTLVRCTPQGVLETWDLTGAPRVKKRYTTQQLAIMCPLYVPRLDRTGRFLLNPVQRLGSKLGRMRFLVVDLAKGRPATFDLPAQAQQDTNLANKNLLPSVSLTGAPGNLRAAVSSGGTVVVVRVPTPGPFDSAMLTALIRTVDAEHHRVLSVDRDGGVLRLWDLRTRRQLAAVRSPGQLAAAYAVFSPDGSRALTTTANGRTALVWNLADTSGSPSLTVGRQLELPGPPGVDPNKEDQRTGLTPGSASMTFVSPDHVVTSALSYVTEWDLANGRRIGETYRPPVQEPVDIATAAAETWAAARPGHDQAAVRTAVGKIEVWDFRKGQAASTVEQMPGSNVKQLAFDPTGRWLAVLFYDGSVRLWDMDDRAWHVLTYQGVQWLGFFASPSRLFTQGTLNTLSLWDVPKATELYHFTPGYGGTAGLTRDASRMDMVEGSDAFSLPLDAGAWAKRICAAAGRGLTGPEKDLTPEATRTDICR
ncbi:nSTAND1 domain-containing NTPase [Streptomyces sulfonofaciens]|uniref:nSTAND1 domain-containing NTPase n=1 Tax=Streptomyces sulfonofaciens TaxID=68272 RepID=UPI001E5CA65E|nr:trypsin-like peptidase domain-containing protein [Streptomyces sulfonofaciens]